MPVCSPAFADRHRAVLERCRLAALDRLPLLTLGEPNYGWLTWAQWFEALGMSTPSDAGSPRFGNYVFLLEAACAGEGVALAWRGLADTYLHQGRLQPVVSDIDWLTTEGGLALVVNPEPRDRMLVDQAVNCLLRGATPS